MERTTDNVIRLPVRQPRRWLFARGWRSAGRTMRVVGGDAHGKVIDLSIYRARRRPVLPVGGPGRGDSA